MPNELSTEDRINTCMGLLDKLVDAQGRAKCGYIYVLSEFLEQIRSDVLIMQEQLKDVQNAPEICIDLNQNGGEN